MINDDKTKSKQMQFKLNHLERIIIEDSRINEELSQKLLQAIRFKEEFANNNLKTAQNTPLDNISSSSSSSNNLGIKVTNGNDRRSAKHDNEESKGEGVVQEIQLDINYNRNHNLSLLNPIATNRDFKGPVIPVLVFACNRVSIRNCLDNLIEYRPNVFQFPIIVSQVSIILRPFFLFYLPNCIIIFCAS